MEDDKNLRQTTQTTASVNQCTLGTEAGPQNIIVRQVIGEAEKQKVQDIQVTVPDPKPAIEQVVDVFVKDVDVTDVEVIRDKVIVRGDYEIKVIYVACLADHPVHALEVRHNRFTQDIEMPGARRGMDADANVTIEFVDYDFDECERYFHDETEDETPDDTTDETADETEDETDDECDEECGDHHHHNNHKHHCHHHHHHCRRNLDVSVVLKIVAKVYADREIQINTATAGTAKG